jgi:hypothetical protein
MLNFFLLLHPKHTNFKIKVIGKIAYKIKKIGLNCLSTRTNLKKKNMLIVQLCECCSLMEEDPKHVCWNLLI